MDHAYRDQSECLGSTSCHPPEGLFKSWSVEAWSVYFSLLLQSLSQHVDRLLVHPRDPPPLRVVVEDGVRF